ncbi:MAG TPA: hypothetical protein VFJ16_26755 [Longimicrobium sp.]|nr:hypothetical protein [Longimicrobium sp.]
MQKALHTLAALATVATLAACGARTEGGDPKTDDSTVESPAATATPAAGDSAAGGTAPYVVQNGGPVTPANGSGQMAPGDTAFGNAGPAGPSGPGGEDTLVTRNKATP